MCVRVLFSLKGRIQQYKLGCHSWSMLCVHSAFSWHVKLGWFYFVFFCCNFPIHLRQSEIRNVQQAAFVQTIYVL